MNDIIDHVVVSIEKRLDFTLASDEVQFRHGGKKLRILDNFGIVRIKVFEYFL